MFNNPNYIEAKQHFDTYYNDKYYEAVVYMDKILMGRGSGKTKKEGYKDKTQLKMTKKIVDAYVAGDRVWDEKHISDRTQEILKEIIEHWNVGKIICD